MSNINPNNINGAYPVAGVDNDSQGFRDNFTNIKNNFAFAQTEIADLQSKAVLKSALTNNTINNNMAGALLSGAEIRDFRETSNDNGVISTSVALDHTTGHYQRVQTNGNITISFTNLPSSGKVGRFRLKLYVSTSTDRLVMPVAVNIGVQYIQEYSSLDNSIGFTQSGIGWYMFEFLTDDAGTTFSVMDLTRPGVASDYSYAAVSNNFTISVTNKLIIDSTQPMLSIGNVNLPYNPVDGQVVSIATGKNINNLYILANSAASTGVMGNISSLNANSYVAWTYVSPANKWFRSN